ncbi:MAG: hypothetical protein ACRDZ5_09325, partial [Acidimicrobiales bacterium]
MTSPRANVWHRLGILELKGAGGEAVDLARTLASHGVATLSPQVVDPAARRLETTASTGGQRPRRIAIRAHGSVRAAVEVAEDNSVLTVAERSRIMALCRRVLGLEVDLMPFYALVLGDPELSWAAAGAGRMLRAPTVFEDVVKTICTTNCSWSATVRMVTAIVESLGEAAADGSRGFPSPVAMAEA